MGAPTPGLQGPESQQILRRRLQQPPRGGPGIPHPGRGVGKAEGGWGSLCPGRRQPSQAPTATPPHPRAGPNRPGAQEQATAWDLAWSVPTVWGQASLRLPWLTPRPPLANGPAETKLLPECGRKARDRGESSPSSP